MSDITFLSPATVSALTPECLALLSSLHVEIIDEDLEPEIAGSQTYVARWKNWLATPRPRVRKINTTTGVETLLFTTADYTIDFAAGQITLTAPTTDIIRIDYFYQPLNNTLLERLLATSVKEVSVLIGRPIDANNIHIDYQAAICKRLYTNILKNLMIETRDFFALGVAGRSVSTDQVPSHFDMIIKQNEAQLLSDLNFLRYYNKTNRFF